MLEDGHRRGAVVPMMFSMPDTVAVRHCPLCPKVILPGCFRGFLKDPHPHRDSLASSLVRVRLPLVGYL